MSTSNWSKIAQAFSRKKNTVQPTPMKLEQLMAVYKKGKVKATERVGPSETLMGRAEMLYRTDPLIFSNVNKLTRRITGTKVYFTGGTEEENAKAELFFENSGMLGLLSHIVKDSILYGYGVGEIVKHKNSKDSPVTITQIDPKEIDFQREDNEIKLGADKNIAGFLWTHNDEEVLLKPEDVLLIRFFTLGEYSLGVSPVEPAYRAAWVKQNILEATGEAIFRHGFPLTKYKIGTEEQGPYHQITPEHLKTAKRVIAEFTSGSDILLPWWMDADTLQTGGIGDVHNFIDQLSMEILAAFEMPKGFGPQDSGTGGRGVEELDFEKSILSFQEDLKRQLEVQLMYPYYESAKFTSKPRLTFVEYAPELQNVKLRRLSSFAKYGLITRNDELENNLRKAEGFPLKKKRVTEESASMKCIFELGECPIRREEALPLDKLNAFCNICPKRMEKEKTVKGVSKDGSSRKLQK